MGRHKYSSESKGKPKVEHMLIPKQVDNYRNPNEHIWRLGTNILIPIFHIHPFFRFFEGALYFSWKSFNLLIEFGVSSSILSNTTLGCRYPAFDWICILCTSVNTRDYIAWAYIASWCPPSSHSVFIAWSTSSTRSRALFWLSPCEIRYSSSPHSLSSTNASEILHDSKTTHDSSYSSSKKSSGTEASNIALNPPLFIPKYVLQNSSNILSETSVCCKIIAHWCLQKNSKVLKDMNNKRT